MICLICNILNVFRRLTQELSRLRVNKAPGAELPHLGAENSELRQKRPGESHAQAQHIRSQDLSSFVVRFQQEVIEEDKLPASSPFKRMKELKKEITSTEVNIS
jgi:hypothetical protein